MIDGVTGPVCQVSTKLRMADRLGGWKMRWDIGRMDYRVPPGLYAVGWPHVDSPVLVAANYKLSFDRLRCELDGLSVWILVIDTRGINVWCAAGKGTFSTDEIVRSVQAVRLSEVVSHRTLIVPQLGAPGVAAHEVRKDCGFRVVYGPVRASDIRSFLAAGMQATPEMRRVRFSLVDRLAVVPVDMVQSAKYAFLIAGVLLVLAGVGQDGYSTGRLLGVGIPSAICFVVAFVAGTALTPALLPLLPGRALATKGAWIGLALFAIVGAWSWATGGLFNGWVTTLAWFLLIPATVSFMAMKYTGSTTYTSLSGVRREMRVAVPLQLAAFVVGMGFWIAGRFV